MPFYFSYFPVLVFTKGKVIKKLDLRGRVGGGDMIQIRIMILKS